MIIIKRLLFTLLFCFSLTNCFGADLSISPAKEVAQVTGKQIFKASIGGDTDNVVIGDEKAPDTFKNKITFKKWPDKNGNYENTLSIIPPADLITSDTPTLTAGKLEVKDAKIGFYFNPDPDNPDNFKFGLILYEKPTTNTWSFQLGGDWQDMDFFYQEPWLNVEEFIEDGETWVRNLDTGKDTRSLKVQGSYAIYHKTKVSHIIGQTNYMSGKFGHIFRPRILDADSKQIGWVDLHIENGIYTLTIDQKILEDAKYPLKFNDWFGTQNQGGSSNFVAVNDTTAIQLSQTSPAGTNTLNYLSFYGNGNATNVTVKFGLYSNKTGTVPLTLLAVDASAWTPGNSVEWKTNPVDMNYGLTASTQYWAANGAIVNDTFVYYYDGSSSYKEIQDYNASFPATWTRSDEVNTSRIYSVYATYTPSGGGATGSVIIMVN